MQVAHRHFRWLAILALCFALVRIARAEDRVVSLTHMLSSSSDKTRLAAVLALAKLGTPPVQKPLTTALGDASPRVRAVAATALGRLGCVSALAALRALTTDDPDESVRQAASNAAIKLAQAPPPHDDAAARRIAPAARGHDEAHAELYLLVSSSADDSPGTTDKATRKGHAEIIKRVLTEQLRGEPSVTSSDVDAKRWQLDARHIDLSVTKLDTVRTAGVVEVRAELRLAISDDKGKLLSFLTGGAKEQVPAAKFDPSYVPTLRKDVLESAMRGMFQKLMAHLRAQST